MNIVSMKRSNPKAKAWSVVAFLFFVLLLVHIPIVLIRADTADEQLHNLIPTCCDDAVYQIPAINMMYGKGFSQSFSVPFDLYHLARDTPFSRSAAEDYEAYGVQPPRPDFQRTPGFPILLTLTYAIFGNNPLNARRMLALQGIATALLLYFAGINLSKWPGVIAGGLVAIYFLDFQPGLIQPIGTSYGALLTEAPTAFWIALFCLAFIVYLKQHRTRYLVLASIGLAGAIFTRANLLTAIFPLALYLWLTRHKVSSICLFVTICVAPVVIWSIYASIVTGKFVAFSTQGDSLFAETNNMDMITGSIQNSPGDWSPGYEKDANGQLIITYVNDAKSGESGWSKGFTFWRENFSLLPTLFYIKLNAGFWNYYGFSVNVLQPERLHLFGIGLLLAMLGLRIPPKRLDWLSSGKSGTTVLLMLVLLLILGNHSNFLTTFLIWLIILIFALLFPYGDLVQLGFVAPVWFLAFVVSHLITTLIFYGLRFHWPLDAPLLLISLTGILTFIQYLVGSIGFHRRTGKWLLVYW